ncbi:MAG TPA: hypothetical protein VH062_09010 [Polyangiaceae bacterium]|jgi:hypothetical protein|nr:hypothetical protein [Polyangiaceae bacterium]
MSDIDIDALYDAFCSGLPADVRVGARALGHTLGLVPSPEVPWGSVFKNEVTLGAPVLFAEGMVDVGRPLVEKAAFAHMLSVIEAFGSDRIADAQVDDTPELRRLLSLIRATRDDALESVGGPASRALATDADRLTHEAIDGERRLLLSGEATDLDTYQRLSAGKQAVGFPASVALATVAGWTAARLDTLERTLMGVWLGLQHQDDVADWEDDARRGGAWIVAVAGGAPAEERTDATALRQHVFSSGILARVLDLACERYAEAAAGARMLGARRLAEWADARRAEATAQAEGERKSPGFVDRQRRLNAWRAEVLG